MDEDTLDLEKLPTMPCLCGAKDMVCDECGGSGKAEEPVDPDDDECDECEGEGIVYGLHDEDCPANEEFFEAL
ncbi:hypothetical protein ACFXPX_13855 [Kitasatospora sp. NPDC059146]|uniref:hypothetical protein n=1 Tax=Kitasatospora sp. NPDC059146 TaxID=3346741 RepID=UPI0036B9BF59